MYSRRAWHSPDIQQRASVAKDVLGPVICDEVSAGCRVNASRNCKASQWGKGLGFRSLRQYEPPRGFIDRVPVTIAHCGHAAIKCTVKVNTTTALTEI